MVLEVFPDPVEHGKQAIGRIATEASAKRSPDIVGRTVDAVTHGVFQSVKEGARVLVDFGLVPGMKLTAKAVKGAVTGAIGTTGTLLASLPVIPTLHGDSSMASANDLRFGRASIFPRPAADTLQSPRDPRSGQGQTTGNPDTQPRAA